MVLFYCGYRTHGCNTTECSLAYTSALFLISFSARCGQRAEKLEEQHMRTEKVTFAEWNQDSRYWGSDGNRRASFLPQGCNANTELMNL